jgi:hypothetical protein
MEADVARKKQHLRYQAKKGRSQSIKNESTKLKKSDVKSDNDVVNTSKNLKKKYDKSIPAEVTKLSDTETKFIRKEIIYIGFISLVLVIFYIIIFLVFKYSSIDEWLSSFIQLGQ